MAFATEKLQRYRPDPAFDRAALRAVARALGWIAVRPPARAAPVRVAPPRPSLAASPARHPGGAAAGAAPVSSPAPAAARAAPVSSPTPAAARAAPVSTSAAPPAPRAAPVDPGAVPRRPMRLAEYLFHRGRVRWSDVLEALRWQRAQRPMVGRIALEWGYLSHADIRELIVRRSAERAYDLPLCEYARRTGFLTGAQASAILGQQRRLQRRIGEYFVARGLLGRGEVDALAAELAIHNARARASAGEPPSR